MASNTLAPPSYRRAQSRVANDLRNGADPEVLAEHRRDLAEEQIAFAIDRALSKAPPLTDEQCDRLAARLRGVPTDAAVA